jgi:uncharacterized protein (TIGR01777 family)
LGTVSIFGATGFIGRKLIKTFTLKGFKINIFSTNIENAEKIFKNLSNIKIYDINEIKSNTLIESDIIINLSGASIGGKRWTERYKKIILDSRIETTKKIVGALFRNKDCRNKLLINASAVGIYGNKGEYEVTEFSDEGKDFLAEICRRWEVEAINAENTGCRVALIRMGIVLDKNKGALKRLVLPFKFFTGGYISPGNQWLSWIHIEDLINAILFIIDNPNIKGKINCTSPAPVTNRQFNKTLGKILKRPCFLKIPKIILRIITGEFSNSLINGQKVLPYKLSEFGYKFRYIELEEALCNLILND